MTWLLLLALARQQCSYTPTTAAVPSAVILPPAIQYPGKRQVPIVADPAIPVNPPQIDCS